MAMLNSWRITGPEGNHVVLSVTETGERSQVVLAIQRLDTPGHGSSVETITLDYTAWRELMDLSWRIGLASQPVQQVEAAGEACDPERESLSERVT